MSLEEGLMVKAPNGAWIEIDPLKTWHNFRRGDVVTCENEQSQWFGKRVVLDGVDKKQPNIMYGRIQGQDFSYFTYDPYGLILLERPGYPFKSGDDVNFNGPEFNFRYRKLSLPSCTIVAINPAFHKYLIKCAERFYFGFQFANWMPQIAMINSSFYYIARPSELSLRRQSENESQTLLETVSAVIRSEQSEQRRTTVKEEIIIDANNVPHPVDTSKKIFYFQPGDIITCDEGELEGKRIRVRGVEIGEYLFGEVIGESRVLRTNHPDGLILLERTLLPFKVGSRVSLPSDILTQGRIPEGNDFKGTILIIDPSMNSFFVVFDEHLHDEKAHKVHPWFPKAYQGVTNWMWCAEAWFIQPQAKKGKGKKVENGSAAEEDFLEEFFEEQAEAETRNAVQAPETAPQEETAAVLPPSAPPPAWFEELSVDIKAKRAHFFIIHGNIYDWQRNAKAKRVTLRQYLAEAYRDSMVICYSLSEGISFGSADDEQWFRNRLAPAQGDDAASSARQRLAQKVQGARAQGGSLADLVGRTPDAVLPMLERLLVAGEKEAPKKRVLVVESAHNIAPRQITPAERATIETLERWARDERFQKAGSLIFLTTPFKGQIAESLSSSFSGTRSIRVPKPDETARISYWREAVSESGLTLAEGLNAEVLGRLTGGLSFRQIDDLCALAKVKGEKIELDFVKNEKHRILDDEFGDRVKIKVPQFGFESFGGKENVRAFLLQVRDNILRGILHRVPMGILASGPPGTGKTFLFECWANECGFNFVEIENVRSKWVGESEEIMEKILAAIDDLSPVIVVEDEADQSEPSRDAPSGDSGVSSRLRQMKFKFCGEPKRRGRVVWVRISNRDDLLDDAFKRKGRSDANIPFVFPSEAEYIKIFEVMFKRYGIAATITDFAPFAKLVTERVYCTGADVEWMVLEADKLAGAQNKEAVEPAHLEQAIGDWEMDLDKNVIDNQIILAIRGSNMGLRPENWEKIIADAERRIEERAKALLPQLSSV